MLTPESHTERIKAFWTNFKARLDWKPAFSVLAFRQYGAEFLATAFFIFCSTGAVVAAEASGNVSGPSANLIVALSFGFSIAAMVYAVTNVSGGHLNPAITLALMVTGNKNHLKGVFYVLFQFLGAAVGSAFLRAVSPKQFWEPVELGATTLGDGMSAGMGFVFEMILTFGLVFTVCGTVRLDNSPTNTGRLAGLAIGLTVFMGHIVGKPFTGPSMNPARSFGPFLVTNYWPSYAWIYFFGPIIGGLVAAVVYQFLLTPRASEPSPENDQAQMKKEERKQVTIEAHKAVVAPEGTTEDLHDSGFNPSPR